MPSVFAGCMSGSLQGDAQLEDGPVRGKGEHLAVLADGDIWEDVGQNRRTARDQLKLAGAGSWLVPAAQHLPGRGDHGYPVAQVGDVQVAVRADRERVGVVQPQ